MSAAYSSVCADSPVPITGRWGWDGMDSMIRPPPLLPIIPMMLSSSSISIPDLIFTPPPPRNHMEIPISSPLCSPPAISAPVPTPPPRKRNRKPASSQRKCKSKSAPEEAVSVKEKKVREVVLSFTDEIAFSFDFSPQPPPHIARSYTSEPRYFEGLGELDSIEPMNPDSIQSYLSGF